jgi:transposase
MKVKKEKTLSVAAAKSGMDEKTARKYLRKKKLPSQLKASHEWRTRKDPFVDVWIEALTFLWNFGIESKSIFCYFQRKYPGKFQDGQLRTFQRKVKSWRALEGPPKEVYFPQKHYPGDLCASDFTSMNKLNITINCERFEHIFFHFVLTYSNWETGTICFSESYESLAEGIQNALWELGGVPGRHRTDNLSAAIYSDLFKKEFTVRYKSFLNYYGLKGEAINSGKSNENGDAEQSHNRLKKALDQALILRGSRDFINREEYQSFIRNVLDQLNSGRRERFEKEIKELRRLPKIRLNDYKKIGLKVGPSSTLNISHNVYSVHSRLIGERVEIRLYSSYIEIWYAQKRIDQFPRLRGDRGHRINYRHIIDYLVRKPGAFENYRYRDDLFPTTRFRMAYDFFKKYVPRKASSEYTQVLYLAATETEEGVDNALRTLFDKNEIISASAVISILDSRDATIPATDVTIDAVNLSHYDELLSGSEIQEMNYGNRYQQ